jgi:hypothetical protein
MNEEAFQLAYELFVADGYSKSIDEFKTLMASNQEAKKVAYDLFVNDGYSKSIDDFSVLIGADGLKKKDDSVQAGEEVVSMESPTLQGQAIPIRSATNADEEFARSQASITPDLIEKDEEFVVPKLKFEYEPYGFSFEEKGLGDYMDVKAYNGETMSVALDPFFGIGSEEDAAALRDFLEKNKVRPVNPVRPRFRTDEEVVNTVKSFNKETQDFVAKYNELKSSMSQLEHEFALDFGGMTKEQIQSDPVKSDMYNEWVNKANAIKGEALAMEAGRVSFEQKGRDLDRMAGEYAQMQSQQGGYVGGLVNSFLTGSARTTAGAVGDMVDLVTYFLPNVGGDEKQYKKGLIAAAEKKGYPVPEDPDSMTREELVEFYGGDTNDLKKFLEGIPVGMSMPDDEPSEPTMYDELHSEVLNNARRDIKYGEDRFRNPFSGVAASTDTSEGIVDVVRKALPKTWGDSSTTTAWADMKKQGFWGGAILGVTESLPTMMGNFAQRTAQMYAQVSDHLMEEMDNNPEFDGISESEKRMVQLPVAITSGILESVGVRNVLNKGGLVNGIAARALGKSTASTSAKTFAEFVQQDISSMVGRGLLTFGAAGAAEFETGFAQQLAETTTKTIYNAVKDKEMFQTPDSLYEYFTDAVYAGAQEAVGSFIIGTPIAVSSAIRGQALPALDNRVFEMFEAMSSDDTYVSMYRAKQRDRIVAGEITAKEAKEEEAIFNRVRGILQTDMSEYTTEQRKEIVGLLYQKQLVEERKSRKAKELRKSDQKIVDAIDERIAEIDENRDSATNIDSLYDETMTDEEAVVDEEPVTPSNPFGVRIFGESVSNPDMTVPSIEQKMLEEGEPENEQERKVWRDKLRVIDRAYRSIYALQSIMPNVDIVLHEDTDSHRKALDWMGKQSAKAGGGTFIFKKGEDGKYSGRIDIDLSTANRRTVAHEVAHAVMLHAFGNNQKTLADFQRKLSRIVDRSTNKKLKQFVANYDQSLTAEEYLAELTGYLADGDASLDTNLLQDIALMINQLVSKLTGGKITVFDDLTDAVEIGKFFRQVAHGIILGDDIVVQPTTEEIAGETGVRNQLSAEENFERWKGGNKEYEGAEIQDIKTGEPVVVKVYHGTTHEFYEFDSTVKGTLMGHFGRVNYFTSSERDADRNYAGKGPDLANRIDGLTDAIADALDNNEDVYEYLNAAYPYFDTGSLDPDMSNYEIAQRVASDELDGRENRTLELYVKMDNPVVLNGKSSWMDVFPEESYSEYIEDAATEIAEENDVTIEEAKEEYDLDIRYRAIDLSGIENPLVGALQKAIDDNNVWSGSSETEASVILQGFDYDSEVDLSEFERYLRKAEGVAFLESNEGDIVASQVIADTFKFLGFDGIILNNVSEIFKGMGLAPDVSHVHVFNEFNNQIKLADGTNTTFDPSTADIRYQVVGENANLSQKVRDNLDVARQMEAEGVDKRDVRIATGWERGADGKWRYEIQDDIPFYKSTVRQINEFFREGLDEGSKKIGYKAKLLLPEELLRLYPKLNNIAIYFDRNLSEGEGYYDRTNNKIIVASGVYLENTVSVLLHEVQHVIQDIEGFAMGGSLSTMRTPNDVIESIILSTPELSREQGRLVKNEYMKKGLKRLPVSPRTFDILTDDSNLIDDYIEKLEVLVELFPEEKSYKLLLNALDLKLLEMGGENVAYTKYRRLAGEVEARNVESRMNMSPEQRRQSLLQSTEDVVREDQILFFGNEYGIRYQLPSKSEIFVKKARAQGYSDAQIEDIMVRRGLDPEEVKDLVAKMTDASKVNTPLTEDWLTGYDRVMKEVQGLIKKVKKRTENLPDGVDMDRMAKDVEAYVRGAYINIDATDQQREQLVRDALKMAGVKTKSSPSAGRVLGKPKPKRVTTNEMAALKDQIRLEARAATMAKIDQDNKRKSIAEAISTMLSGLRDDVKITKKKFNAIQKKLARTNLNNPIMVERLINYVEAVSKDAEHKAKMDEAAKLRSRVKKLSKRSKYKDALMLDIAKAFAKIDPFLIMDVDAYIVEAKKIVDGIKSTVNAKSGLEMATPFDVYAMEEYVDDTILEQNENVSEAVGESLMNAMGVDGTGMSIEEMIALLAADELTKEQQDKLISEVAQIKRTNISEAFDVLSAMVKEILRTGKDPFTDEDVEMTEDESKLMRWLSEIDILSLNNVDQVRTIDALNNFLVNQSVSGVGALVQKEIGIKNAKKLADSGKVARLLKFAWSPLLGRLQHEHLVQLPLVLERYFGATGARRVMNLSGLSEIIKGKATSTKMVNLMLIEYVDRFGKTSPNQEAFNAEMNVHERGAIAFMGRSLTENDTAEFTRRKKLMEQSIEALMGGSVSQIELAVKYQEIYDALVRNANSIEDVYALADPTNVEAVQWWRDKWAEQYPALAAINLQVYNETLNKDLNYIPDTHKRVQVSEEVDLNEGSSFRRSSSHVDKTKSGTLTKATRPDNLQKDARGDFSSYISLDFDFNNANAMQSALVDIHTANAVMKLDGFLNSPSFKKIMPVAEDRELVSRRIKSYVKKMKGNDVDAYAEDKAAFKKWVDYIGTMGVARALGAINQGAKQTIPVAFNTMINADGRLDLSIITSKEIRDFIANSGMPIGNRNATSQASLDFLDELIERAADSNTEKALANIKKLNRFWLKTFLQAPDVFIAQASFITYYKQNLRNRGIEVDYSNPDQEALEYAQYQVDRQQNTSDHDLQGEFFTSNTNTSSAIRKVLFPFANFALNQKARMYADLTELTSRTGTREDKIAAVKSLAGLTVEMAMFYGMGAIIRYGIMKLAYAALGFEEDEDERLKRIEKEKRMAMTNIVRDIFSPLPPTDDGISIIGNAVIGLVEGEDEEWLRMYEPFYRGEFAEIGIFGIQAQRLMEVGEQGRMAIDGTFSQTSPYGKTTEYEVPEHLRATMGWMAAISLLSNSGILPQDFDMAAKYITKKVKSESK